MSKKLMRLIFNICIFISISSCLPAQQIKFNSSTGLVYPIKVNINTTPIDSVKKYFGKNYTVKNNLDEITIEYGNGLSFGYRQYDSALLVRTIIIGEKANVTTPEGMTIGKSTAEDVLRIYPDARIYNHAYVSKVITKDFECYTGKKGKLSLSDKIMSIKKEGYYDSYNKPSRKTPANNSRIFLDSILGLEMINLSVLDNFLDKFSYGEKYYNINFQKYDNELNEFGYQNVFADAFISTRKISFFFMAKNDQVIFFVSEENDKRKVVIKDDLLYRDFTEKYKKLHGTAPDLNDPVIVPMDSPHFVGFAYEKGNDKIEKDSIEKRYKEYSTQLASLNAETQAGGIEGFFYLKGQGAILTLRDKAVIDFLGHSKKTLKVTSYHGCFSHSETKNFKKLVKRYKRGKSFPRGYHRTYSFGPGMIR